MIERKRKLEKKDIVKAAIIALVLVAAMIGLFVLVNKWENDRYASNLYEEYDDTILNPKTVTYNGVTYEQKRKVYSYLFIGVDEKGEAAGTQGYINGGQGDVQMLLVVDDLNRTWQILQLNRDSMVEVPVLDIKGNEVSSEFQQLCLAHSYGDGLELSCENNVNAVMRLLDDQPISGYMALNMDGVSVLNNLVGGVTVTVTSDFSTIDETLVEGEEVTLTDEQALLFVRSRKNIDDETNIARMARQRVFMNALIEELQDKDATFAKDAYEALDSYMVSNLTSVEASKVFQRLKNYEKLETITIDGDNEVLGENWAYYLDEDSLQCAILELFYGEKE